MPNFDEMENFMNIEHYDLINVDMNEYVQEEYFLNAKANSVKEKN